MNESDYKNVIKILNEEYTFDSTSIGLEVKENCYLCGKTSNLVSSVIYYKIGDKDAFTSNFCSKCLANLGLGSIWLRKANEVHKKYQDYTMKKASTSVNVDDDVAFTHFYNELTVDEPDFAHYAGEFSGDAYMLQDNTEDPVLGKIYRSTIMEGVYPTEREKDTFNNRCSYYLDKIRKGEPLLSPESMRATGDRVEDIFTDIFNNAKAMNASTKSFITSLYTQFNGKGYLSEKQFKSLEGVQERVLNSLTPSRI